MTTARSETSVPARRPPTTRLLPMVVIGAGCLLLALRPLLRPLTNDTTPALLVLFTALLVAGLAWPVRAAAGRPPATVVALVAVVGVAAFVTARLVAPGQAAAPFGARPLLLDGFAAIAEEAFFRRLLFAALLEAAAGPGDGEPAPAARHFAIAGSAALFAVVHVTVYGFSALPIDLAAGLLLSWQRDATGTWTVPAITHVIANTLAVI